MAEDVRIYNRPGPRWQGAFIVVDADNTWAFYRCCRCGRRLSDPDSRARGFGPECANREGIAEVVENAKTMDRVSMRLALASRRAHARTTTARRRASS